MIRATILLCAARLLVPRLRSRSAAERHLLWAAVFGVAAVLPWLQAILPAWRPQWAETLTSVLPASLEYFAPWAGGGGTDVVVRATGVEAGHWAPLLLPTAWAAGALVAGAALAVQLARLSRIAASAERVADARLVRLFHRMADGAELPRRPALLQSAFASIPMTWGVRRPQVLLPAQAVNWSSGRLTAVFAHELAHVGRGDWALHMLAEVVCAIYWFDPLFWIARQELRRESDLAADDVVLSRGIDGREYAAHLLAIVRGLRGEVPAPAVAMARSSDLAARVASLVGVPSSRRAATRVTTLVVAGAAVFACVPLAAFAGLRMAASIQVRTTTLPRALLAAVSPSTDVPSPAVRHVRIAAPRRDASSLAAPEVTDYTTPPLYSDDALRRGIEGVLVIHALVNTDGRAGPAHIVRGLGYGLDQNALVALRQWRFRPGTRDGAPVAMEADIEVEFSLRQEALNELIANDMATQVGPGVTPPRAVITVQPPPTPRARGRVVLDVVLLEDGRPKIVRILQSAGAYLDERAVHTFEQWRFSPALRDNTPVKVRMTAEVSFHG